MKYLLVIIRGYIIFIAASGFLFGQLFFGNSDLYDTMAGIFGLVSGILGGSFAASSRLRKTIIICCCLASILGVALGAYNYYTYLKTPGNYYAWFLTIPYCICLLFIIWHLIKKQFNKINTADRLRSG